MEVNRDSSGHLFADTGGVRVTFVPSAGRESTSDWVGSDVIRVQAYRGQDSQSLHMGAEIPIRTPAEFGDLVATMCQVYIEAMSQDR